MATVPNLLPRMDAGQASIAQVKVLHICPHLGGGVGKAHAAMAPYIGAEQTFALLTEPQDRRYVDAIRRYARVCERENYPALTPLIRDADIVQFEYWDHPSLTALLAADLPSMRAVFWQHKRSLPKPPGRVVYTSELSGSPFINSGFGFETPPRANGRSVAYLGTTKPEKMSPVFFEVMDRVTARAFIYGHASQWAKERVRRMDHPYRVRLEGHTDSPQSALRRHGIFLYTLAPGHYGTGENALCEAMSLGLVPIVLNNEVERAIVPDDTFVCDDADECVSVISRLLDDPSLMRNMSDRAIERARAFSPERSAQQFMELWAGMMGESKVVLQTRTERLPEPDRLRLVD